MIQARFSLSIEAFRARVEELACAAGLSPEAYAERASLEDLYLASACAAGDQDAWAECEATHFAFVRRFAQRFLPDAEARDLADELIADLWQRQKIGRYSGRSSLRTWLGALIAHAAANRRRTLKPAATFVDGTVATRAVDRLEDADQSRLLADVVAHALATLSAEEKLLLHLYYEQGLTLDQMERVTRTSKATLSRRLKSIRETLRHEMDRRAAQLGTSADQIREGIRFERLELDLSSLLRSARSLEGETPKRV